MHLQVKCLTLFVTHYLLLGELEVKYPKMVGNFHMAYVEAEESSELVLIVVLYYISYVLTLALENLEQSTTHGLEVLKCMQVNAGLSAA